MAGVRIGRKHRTRLLLVIFYVERISEAAANLDWLHDRLPMQVLDDSTDRPTTLARAAVRSNTPSGIDSANSSRH